ncbi:MAG: MCP four helix bundle domain-containing protein [Deltaproteobacteria bacterium]|nr:MCP four helix bundle domain-containing protein [Deltaproteobacteria bacterium]
MLNNFKVSVRLGAGFGFVLFMLVLMMLIGINRMQSIQEKLETIANRDMAILETVGAMQNASMQQAVLVRDLLSYEDLALQKQAFQKL